MRNPWKAIGCIVALTIPLGASTLLFSTGSPDGLIGTLSQPASGALPETETADDFILNQSTSITQATITGLLPSGLALSNIKDVEIELYHIFPVDSGPFSGNVPTRVNSPSDSEFIAFDSGAGTLAFSASLLSSSFAVTNTVVNGIHKSLNPFTGGEGAVTGEEVLLTITFSPSIILPGGHFFFRPEVQLTDGNFLWLSAPKPIVGGTGPFTGDLQTWIRNSNLSPDWLRVGTDITHQGPFNASFSLSGDNIPEPSTAVLWATGLLALGWGRRQWSRR